jgi:hypothetical protein
MKSRKKVLRLLDQRMKDCRLTWIIIRKLQCKRSDLILINSKLGTNSSKFKLLTIAKGAHLLQ